MAVACVVVNAHCSEINVNLAGSVCAVDDGEDAFGAGALTDELRGKGERSGGGDVGEGDDFGSWRHAFPQALNEFLWRGERHGHGVIDVFHAALLKVEPPGIVDRAIFVIRGENLVSWFKLQGACNDVNAVGGIRHKDHLICWRVEIGGQFFLRCQHQVLGAATDKVNGVAFQFALPLLIFFKDGARACAEAAVVEKDNIVFDQELAGEFGQREGKLGCDFRIHAGMRLLSSRMADW